MIEEREITEVELDEFFRRVEPVLSRALAAGFGFAAGHDAAAEALTYARRNWSKVARLDNPAAYLYRIGGRRALGQRRRRDQPSLLPVLSEIGDHRVEPGLGAALEALWSRRGRGAALGDCSGEVAAVVQIEDQAAINNDGHLESDGLIDDATDPG